MRTRFDNYLGYGRHHFQLDEDFWQRRQEAKNSLSEARKKRKRTRRSLGVSGEMASEKMERETVGNSSV